jgi:aarF domain-containing kinase
LLIQNVEHFKKEMGRLFREVKDKQLSEIHVGEFMSQVLSLMRRYHVKIEGNFSTLVLGTILLEGIGKQLDPDLNILESSKKFILNNVEDRAGFIKDVLLDSEIRKKVL